MTPSRDTKVFYPVRAIVAVALAALVVLLELVAFSSLIMPLFPLVPVFVAVMLGNALWVAHVVHWAASLGRREPLRKIGVEAASHETAPAARTQAHAA